MSTHATNAKHDEAIKKAIKQGFGFLKQIAQATGLDELVVSRRLSAIRKAGGASYTTQKGWRLNDAPVASAPAPVSAGGDACNYNALQEHERLEFAAKAAGLGYRWQDPNGFDDGFMYIIDGDEWVMWDPEWDDADSFRLHCLLDIQVEPVGPASKPATQVNCWPRGRGDCAAERPYNGDKLKATRQAVFEAAVRLGWSMKS